MPKVTSLASQTSNKENVVPLSKPTRKAKTSSRDEEEQDEVVRLGEVKRTKSINTASRQQAKSASKYAREADKSDSRQHASSSSDSAHVKRAREAEEDQEEQEDQERKSRRERLLEEKLALITRERDQVQSQFDELREMRHTEPEKLLSEWKKAASQRDAKAEEYTNKLKHQLEASSTAKKDSAMSSSSDGAFFHRNGKEGHLSDDSRKYREELARLQLANESLMSALRGRTVQGIAGGGLDDAKAIRRLYEDLTGLVINKVESAVNREKDYHRCFHAIFASDGYYNLEMKFEESESNLNNNGRQSTREDLVYIPTMDADRDADIIASARLPSYLMEPLRFERSTAVRFLDVLHKRLDKTSKK